MRFLYTATIFLSFWEQQKDHLGRIYLENKHKELAVSFSRMLVWKFPKYCLKKIYFLLFSNSRISDSDA